jgi:hypothetical protein
VSFNARRLRFVSSSYAGSALILVMSIPVKFRKVCCKKERKVNACHCEYA